MRHAWTAALLLLLAPSARAADDQPYPLQVKVGEIASLCATGTILCPAAAALCDDASVARPALGPDGLGFEGVGPGTTICSAGAAMGQGARRVYKVTVSGAPRPPEKR